MSNGSSDSDAGSSDAGLPGAQNDANTCFGPDPVAGVVPVPCPPPPAHITVHVQEPSGNPIPGATVSLDGQGAVATTGNNGDYDFGTYPPNTYTVEGKKDGYVPSPSSLSKNAPSGVNTQFVLTLTFPCWTDDYEEEISTPSYGRYSQPYKKDGTPHNYSDRVQYKIYAPVKTGTAITVEIRFKEEVDSGVSAGDAASAKTKLESGLNTHWNGKFTLGVDDPKCGKKTFAIKFKVVWVTSGQHYTIKIHNTYPREGVTGNVMDVSKSTSAWTFAHEVGHCFGLPDEYSYTTDTETVRYYKPDGTLDAPISAPPGGKPSKAADATIMSAVNNTTTLPRHAWCIAIEVKALLSAKLGRAIKCDIT